MTTMLIAKFIQHSYLPGTVLTSFTWMIVFLSHTVLLFR